MYSNYLDGIEELQDIDEKDAKVKEARKMCNAQQEKAQRSNMILQNIRQCVAKLHEKLHCCCTGTFEPTL